MNLTDRRALITGATGKIGQVIAFTLAELGADLILIDLPGSDFTSILQTIREHWPVKLQTMECDLEIQIQREKLVSSIVEQGSNLDILVNNAAFVGTTKLKGWVTDFDEQTADSWRRAMEVNLTAPFDLSKGFSQLLKKSPGGTIINIGSIYGKFGPDFRLYQETKMRNAAAYSASKGGLIQYTRWLATALAPKVRVNSISPGGVFRHQPELFVERYEERTPLQRMATEDDFRGAIAFLASDMSQYVTGHDLAVDGGWGVW